MKKSTLHILSCPACQGDLSLESYNGDGSVKHGSLSCDDCRRDYPIEDGIPQFIELTQLEGLNRQFADSYNWAARFYSFFTKLGFLAMGGERKARLQVLEHLELNGGRILEVSVGTGDNLPYLFEMPGAGEVYGLDISSGQLARCRSRASKQGWPVDLFLANAELLPFKTGSFENVLHLGGINFFSDKKRAIDEMIRVARPGGRIVIADESERVARQVDRLPGFSSSYQGEQADVSIPVHLIPDIMLDLRVHDIWMAHGNPHGYCITFRKPRHRG